MKLETMFITHDGAIATLHLNRTERLNAFGNQGTIDLNAAAEALAADDSTRVVASRRFAWIAALRTAWTSSGVDAWPLSARSRNTS